MLKTMTHSEHDQTACEFEDALLFRAARGSEHAFARLVEQRSPGLELFCYLMLGDDGMARRAMSETVLTVAGTCAPRVRDDCHSSISRSSGSPCRESCWCQQQPHRTHRRRLDIATCEPAEG
jgi:hypothetical protein